MEVTLLTLLGGLAGSVITIGITKALEGRQKKLESRREFNRLFFINKLKAAEEIFSHLSLLSSQLKNLKFVFISYKKLDTDGFIKESPIRDSIMKTVIEIETRIKTTFSNSIHAYGLYFNSDNDKEFYTIYETLMLSLNDISEAFNNYLESLIDSTSPPSINSQILFVEAAKKVDETTSKLDKLDDNITLRLKTLRSFANQFEL